MKENFTIGKKDYEVEIKDLNQADLKFYTKNPRVYSILNISETEPSQEEIENFMCDQEHVKELKVAIEENGGLIDPLIVRDGDFTVLEGNSRLAAYRILCRIDAITWGKVKCKILPATISDAAIFKLLGQYHINGKKDWDPYEQATYLYRRMQETKLPIEAMAQELGMSRQKATGMIDVVEFMHKHNDLNKRRWSYYVEYLKSKSIKAYRDTSDEIDEKIVNQIKTGAIEQAQDIRKLADIAKGKDSQSKKLMKKIISGEVDIYTAHETLKSSGKLDDAVKKLKAFKEYINDDAFEKQIRLTDETYQQAQFEIKRIMQRLEKIKAKH